MITSNRNIFLGIHITQKVRDALKQEVQKQREKTRLPDHVISQSRVGYDLLRQALIEKGYEDLQSDEVL